MFIGDFTAMSFLKGFASLSQKRPLIQRAERWSPSAEGETPLSFQSATEGEFQSLEEALKGGTAQVGGSPFYR